ncbi:MAG TPA: UDP-glucose--hexose-1-phosphate uridylyltransferase [Candidatus Sulfotelmatobacter sp.]|nr:UDP-glucose--hexose-1-phosphate uridylyltransferase [Candidatus Sulfotelmatobacter sp.]
MMNQQQETFRLKEDPHRRLNALTNEWVLVSPHRATRPWQGEVGARATSTALQYDPECYLCPGNVRAGGAHNPAYSSTFVFDNDFAALKSGVAGGRLDVEGKGLIVAESEPGTCRVMCFSPRHDLALAAMRVDEIELVIKAWIDEFRQLAARENIRHVQIFENRGAMMGASNPHPHCQIWATASIPEAPSKELQTQENYLKLCKRCLLCDYLELEEQQKTRLVYQNEAFSALVPFWAVWPFETLICSRRHFGSMLEFSAEEISSLAEMLRRVTSTYDKVFDVPFPYSMGFHQSPTDDGVHPEWHFHAHFYPPLLRSATVRKFMVGFEMLGTPQRDITPEIAAERLQSLVRT